MRISSLALRMLFPGLLSVAAGPVLAQVTPPNDSALSFAGMLAKPVPKATMPDVAAPPSAWPRLDPGAVFCATEDDLARHAAQMRGEEAGPFDCRLVTQPTAIQIVERAGLGRTEVKLTARGSTGWTDAWLPPNPPPGTTPVRGEVAGASAASLQQR
jgi:hypothetical protein